MKKLLSFILLVIFVWVNSSFVSAYSQTDNDYPYIEFNTPEVCYERLQKSIYFKIWDIKTKDIVRYYIVGISRWYNFEILKKDITEKELLHINKKHFFIDKVSPIIEKKHFWDNINFEVNYSDLVTYYKKNRTIERKLGRDYFKVASDKQISDKYDYYHKPENGRRDYTEVSFLLIWINKEKNVKRLSSNSSYFAIDINKPTPNDILKYCKNFAYESFPVGKIISEYKIKKIFKKLDKKYWLESLENTQLYSKTWILINKDEEKKLQKYKRLLEKLQIQVNTYKRKNDIRLKTLIFQKKNNILYYKKKIEDIAHISNMLWVINHQIKESVDYEDYKGINYKGRFWKIDWYLLQYRTQNIERVKDREVKEHDRLIRTFREFNCQRFPDECKKVDVPVIKKTKKLPLDNKPVKNLKIIEKENKDEIEDKYGASEEDVDKYLIRIYYWRIWHKEFEQAYSMKYKPNYSLKHFKEIYSDIWKIYGPKNFIKIKDFYKFKVSMIDNKWVLEVYLVNVKIIDGKIKTLSSKKIK